MTLQLFVKTLTAKTIIVWVEASDCIKDIKTKIQEETGVPPEKQSLTFAGKQLEEDRTLADYNITKESSQYIQVKLRYIINASLI